MGILQLSTGYLLMFPAARLWGSLRPATITAYRGALENFRVWVVRYNEPGPGTFVELDAALAK